MSKQQRPTTTVNLEARFDAGAEVLDYFDTAKPVRRNHKKSRINLDLPGWMLRRIDLAAGRTGIARQAQIKAWLVERLAKEKAPAR